jgi:hypothetical protein
VLVLIMDEIRGVRCAEFMALIYWMGRSVLFYSSGDREHLSSLKSQPCSISCTPFDSYYSSLIKMYQIYSY